MKFSIEAVSKMTGISAVSLRNWEKRYGFPVPKRSESGHRAYSAADVSFLKKAEKALLGGVSLSSLAEQYHQFILESEISEAQASAIAEYTSAPVDDVSYRTELIYESLLRFDLPGTLQHYAILNSKLSPEQMLDLVFEKILRRVGNEWALGRATVAQEHYLSAFVRLRLATFLALEFPPTQTEKISFATLENERHEGGLMILAAHLKFRGYPVTYLGADLPLADLQTFVKTTKPHLVCLSYLSLENFERDQLHFPTLPTSICVGGPAFQQSLVGKRSFQAENSRLFFCPQASGKESADFVEMICRRKVD